MDVVDGHDLLHIVQVEKKMLGILMLNITIYRDKKTKLILHFLTFQMANTIQIGRYTSKQRISTVSKADYVYSTKNPPSPLYVIFMFYPLVSKYNVNKALINCVRLSCI